MRNKDNNVGRKNEAPSVIMLPNVVWRFAFTPFLLKPLPFFFGYVGFSKQN